MKDIITIGDVTEDVFVQLAEAKVTKEKKKQILSMTFGTKIIVPRVDKLLGGNAMNAAIGASRLGLRSAIYAEIGSDAQGDRIKKAIKAEKIATTYVSQQSKETNYSVVLNVNGERTILVYHVPREYTFPKIEKAKWCYYTSISETFFKQQKHLLAWLSKYDIKLAFNPGSFHLKKGSKALAPVLKQVSLLFLNKEEAQLFIHSKSDDILTLAKLLKKTGVETVVITDGPKGSYVYEGSHLFFQDIFPVPVVERTGCGDSYGTGFTVAVMKGFTVQQAMGWGTLNAASVLQHIGPQEGLALESWIKKNLKHKKLPKVKQLV